MSKGDLLIIGGNEDKENSREILTKFVDISREKKGPIGILTTATEYPEELGGTYSRIFKELGASEPVLFHIDTREKAEDPEAAKLLGSCSSLFITGGDQVRLTSILGGTRFYAELKDLWQHHGLLIAGTSAGAAVMSRHMIMSSVDIEDETIVEMGAGFDFVDDAIIDQHFSQRARFGRLMTAIAHNPQIMGIGIDENTAIWVKEEGQLFEVLGEHSVTLFDGKKLTFVDTTSHGDNHDITISGVRLHSLARGYTFDLINRELIKAAGGEQHED
ncbi:cyanophycinase [Paenibacillus tuaregi]|uniref:cyanophycinase n=1 Tax=Paenibacillus tuaregi TaxID=1816681 RepID=UPI000838FF3D|nr:cyanophycinase [Paenibacillus tuaregi]